MGFFFEVIMATTTKLQAVNTLLTSIGEDPVNALGTGLDDQTVAEAILDEVVRKVLVLGWSWNTETNYTLVRQTDKRLTLPSTFLTIDFHNPMLTLRGGRVYDKANHSYLLEADVSCASAVISLPWDEIPEVARQYITYSAGRIFQARQVGSQVLHQFTQKDEQDAWRALMSNEGSTANLSIFQNADLRMKLDRSSSLSASDRNAGTIFGSY